ncbi:enoyl-CoA hydratase/isomerase family protein [Phenylobacterium sp. LjRoot225]|uniref:enoyl-CoA hydratase/isomerase family protein n=1 Tax=Phenylobacterium sp. LjRoot225 TaxID=3342285 RepID=UPI003ECF79CA
MTQATDHLAVDRIGHVAVLTFARPPANHVSVDLLRDIADVLEGLDLDANCRAVVLQAEGKVFCAGADLANPQGVSGMDSIAALYEQALRLFAAELPIVAAIQGAAVGAGLGLSLVADFRVASPEARFSANFVKLGFHPGFGLTHTLPRLIGAQRASLMALTGRRIKAEEALAWGLADAIAPAADLRGAALRLAEEIAENAPLAVAATRKSLRAGLVEAFRAATQREHAQQSILRDTEDFAEGVKAVGERRAGVFVGR